MESKASPPRTARIVAAAFFAALIVKVFFFDLMIAEGRSMIPAIEPGTVIAINRASFGLRNPLTGSYLVRWGMPKDGEIVIFPSPDGNIAVKRCFGPFSADRFIALGDNAAESYDSRQYGPMPIGIILGKVVGKR